MPPKLHLLLGYLSCWLLSGCDRHDHYLKKVALVPIIETQLPATGAVATVIPIKVGAAAGDGCWRAFRFKLTAESPFTYRLQAFGTYESYGACLDVMVGKDTVFYFTPATPGTYLFKSIDASPLVETDTLVVR